MGSNIIGSLSTEGWLSELAVKCDRLLSYFFISDYSQTELYPGEISSLPYLIKMYGSSEEELRTNVSRQLQKYLSRHFEQADVTASTNVISESDFRIELKLIITVYDNNVQYNLGRLVETVNSTIASIVNINN